MPASYLAADHDRIEAFFVQAIENINAIDMDAYQQFRSGLMRHIGIEEKIVFPKLIEHLGEEAKQMAVRLRSDHGAIVALLVPTPDVEVIATLNAILSAHNDYEEGANGVYSMLAVLDEQTTQAMLLQMQQAPEVPTHPTKPTMDVIEITKRAVARAGYAWVEKN